jgi:hypothetical protein
MSNQRVGKWKSASKSGTDKVDAMVLTTFFKSAKEALERAGYEDSAFYFEQCEEWMREGRSINSDARKILGL